MVAVGLVAVEFSVRLPVLGSMVYIETVLSSRLTT
jgi:hypothetical protein